MTDAATKLPLDVGPPVFLLTNRWNLIEILSSGLVLPPMALRKYYRDLMALSSGWVPLLSAPIDHDTMSLVTVEDPATAFPVALELDALPPEAVPGPEAVSGSTVAWATDKVLTLRDIKRVHFRTADERNEHELREYDNVVSMIETTVSPEIFTMSAETAAAVREWLAQRPQRTFDKSLHGILDRIAGGVLAAAGLADSAPAFDVAVHAARAVGDVGDPLEAVAAGVTEILAAESGETDAERVLLKSVLETLAELDPADAWDAVAVVDSVRSRTTGDDQVISRIGRNLEPIRLVLRNERDFNRFKPGAGLTAAKAFFLVLMRPEPERLRSWDPRETGATPTTRGVAAFLSGFLRGRTLLSRGERRKELDEALRDNLAARLNGEKAPHEIGTTPAGSGAALTVDGVVVAQALPAEDALGDLLRSRAPLDETAEKLALALATGHGWDDCVRTTIETSGELTIASVAKGRTRIAVSGAPTLTYELDVERLAARADQDPCESAAAADLRSYLASIEPSPARAKKGRPRQP